MNTHTGHTQGIHDKHARKRTHKHFTSAGELKKPPRDHIITLLTINHTALLGHHCFLYINYSILSMFVQNLHFRVNFVTNPLSCVILRH